MKKSLCLDLAKQGLRDQKVADLWSLDDILGVFKHFIKRQSGHRCCCFDSWEQVALCSFKRFWESLSSCCRYYYVLALSSTRQLPKACAHRNIVEYDFLTMFQRHLSIDSYVLEERHLLIDSYVLEEMSS